MEGWVGFGYWQLPWKKTREYMEMSGWKTLFVRFRTHLSRFVVSAITLVAVFVWFMQPSAKDVQVKGHVEVSCAIHKLKIIYAMGTHVRYKMSSYFCQTKSKNWSKRGCFWMFCMLPCSRLLNSERLFFYILLRGCFTSKTPRQLRPVCYIYKLGR